MENKVSYIYKCTNLVNGKVYIGQSIDPINRIRQHINVRSKHSYLLNYAIKKYGVENFLFEVIRSDVPIEQINETEIQCIKEYSCKVPIGYNITDGGKGHLGHKPSEETRKKMSIAQRNMSLENKQKITVARKAVGYEKSILAARARIGKPAWNKGIPNPSMIGNKLALGNKLSDEVKKRMSESQKKVDRSNYPPSKNRIAIIQLDLAGLEIDRFDSAWDAGKKLNIASDSIIRCINGIRKSAGGYRWVKQ